MGISQVESRRYPDKMTAGIELESLQSLRVSTFQIPAHGVVPNTSLQGFPLLIYHRCILSKCSSTIIEKHLKEIDAVSPQWRYTMYSTSHFHSTTHEVLCITCGSADLLFGGDDNPERVEVTTEKGDVIIIPAGVSHKLVKDHQGNFQMIGSYPPGKKWDMCYGKKGDEERFASIKDLAWFKKDPIYGDDGPVLTYEPSS